jgi:3-hydroxyethyl bacteriochlorophyllide a dehydrogenase
MDSLAVVLHEPMRIELTKLELADARDGDLVVDTEWSGISTGTERLLWSGRMPHFPGMGYPLVPGYESVGRVVYAGSETQAKPGDLVFVPGAQCYGAVRGLFGGTSSRIVLPEARALKIDEALGERGTLLALAATAYHAIAAAHDGHQPDLIVGHGALGRLLARIAIARGGQPPVVWEKNPARAGGAEGYRVLSPEEDERRDYRAIYDASGDAGLIDTLVQRLTPGGEIVLAGFYSDRPSFAFPPAFVREARFRIAAQWQRQDLLAVAALVASGKLSLDGLITHSRAAGEAASAYETAFGDPACLKMILNWRSCA